MPWQFCIRPSCSPALICRPGGLAPAQTSSHATDPAESALFTGIFGLALAISLPIVWKRYTGNFLNLSPDGFYAQEKPVKFNRWDDVLDILDFVPWADRHLHQLRTHR